MGRWEVQTGTQQHANRHGPKKKKATTEEDVGDSRNSLRMTSGRWDSSVLRSEPCGQNTGGLEMKKKPLESLANPIKNIY